MSELRSRKMRARLRLWRKFGIHSDGKLAGLALDHVHQNVALRAPDLNDDDIARLMLDDDDD
jgi:hypothetical protein